MKDQVQSANPHTNIKRESKSKEKEEEIQNHQKESNKNKGVNKQSKPQLDMKLCWYQLG